MAYGCPSLLVDADVGDWGVGVFLEGFLEFIDSYVLRKIVDVNPVVKLECVLGIFELGTLCRCTGGARGPCL